MSHTRASSPPPYGSENAPTGTRIGKGRWWWNRGPRRRRRDRSPTVRRRTADERLGSASVRSRRRCTSDARGWRRPGWSARLCRETRRGRAWVGQSASRLQCRANFRGRSVAQRPRRGTDPNRRSRANDGRHASARSTCEIIGGEMIHQVSRTLLN